MSPVWKQAKDGLHQMREKCRVVFVGHKAADKTPLWVDFIAHAPLHNTAHVGSDSYFAVGQAMESFLRISANTYTHSCL